MAENLQYELELDTKAAEQAFDSLLKRWETRFKGLEKSINGSIAKSTSRPAASPKSMPQSTAADRLAEREQQRQERREKQKADTAVREAERAAQRVADIRSQSAAKIIKASEINAQQQKLLLESVTKRFDELEMQKSAISSRELQRRAGQIQAAVSKELQLQKTISRQAKQQRLQGGADWSKLTTSAFQLQQIAEDASFAGWRGISNNISFMAASLGGPGGLIALLGLAAYQTVKLTSGTEDAADGLGRQQRAVDGLNDSLTRQIQLQRELSGRVRSRSTGDDVASLQQNLAGIQQEQAQFGGLEAQDKLDRLRQIADQRKRFESLADRSWGGWFRNIRDRATGSAGNDPFLQDQQHRDVFSSAVPIEEQRSKAEARLAELLQEELSLRAQLKMQDNETLDAAETRLKDKRRELESAQQLLNIAKERESLDQRMTKDRRFLEGKEVQGPTGVRSLFDDLAKPTTSSPKEVLSERLSQAGKGLKLQVDELVKTLDRDLEKSLGRESRLRISLKDEHDPDKRLKLEEQINQEMDRQAKLMAGAVADAERLRSKTEETARWDRDRLERLDKAADAMREQKSALDSALEKTRALLTADLLRAQAIREAAQAHKDAYFSSSLSGESSLIDLHAEKQIEGLNKYFDRLKKVQAYLDQFAPSGIQQWNQGLIDQQQQASIKWIQEDALRRKDAVNQREVDFWKQRAEDEQRKGEEAAARGDTDIAQKRFDRALQFREQRQQKFLSEIRNGSEARGANLAAAADAEEAVIDRLFDAQEKAMKAAAEREEGRLKTLQEAIDAVDERMKEMSTTKFINESNLDTVTKIREELEKSRNLLHDMQALQTKEGSQLGGADPNANVPLKPLPDWGNLPVPQRNNFFGGGGQRFFPRVVGGDIHGQNFDNPNTQLSAKEEAKTQNWKTDRKSVQQIKQQEFARKRRENWWDRQQRLSQTPEGFQQFQNEAQRNSLQFQLDELRRNNVASQADQYRQSKLVPQDRQQSILDTVQAASDKQQTRVDSFQVEMRTKLESKAEVEKASALEAQSHLHDVIMKQLQGELEAALMLSKAYMEGAIAKREMLNSGGSGGGLPGMPGGAPASVPGKAAGGPVSAGQMYLTGEQGPEFFIPQVNGMILNNRQSELLTKSHLPSYAAPTTQAAPQNNQNITFGQVNVNVPAGITMQDLQRQTAFQTVASRIRKG